MSRAISNVCLFIPLFRDRHNRTKNTYEYPVKAEIMHRPKGLVHQQILSNNGAKMPSRGDENYEKHVDSKFYGLKRKPKRATIKSESRILSRTDTVM